MDPLLINLFSLKARPARVLNEISWWLWIPPCGRFIFILGVCICRRLIIMGWMICVGQPKSIFASYFSKGFMACLPHSYSSAFEEENGETTWEVQKETGVFLAGHVERESFPNHAMVRRTKLSIHEVFHNFASLLKQFTKGRKERGLGHSFDILFEICGLFYKFRRQKKGVTYFIVNSSWGGCFFDASDNKILSFALHQRLHVRFLHAKRG